MEETDSDLSSVASTILYGLSKSYQLVSIQSISGCNQLLSIERGLRKKNLSEPKQAKFWAHLYTSFTDFF